MLFASLSIEIKRDPNADSQAVEDLSALQLRVLTEKDTSARRAFEENNLSVARETFQQLANAHKRHQSSDRAYYINACVFGINVKSFEGSSLLPKDGSAIDAQLHEQVRGAIGELKRRENNSIAHAFVGWRTNVRDAILQFLHKQKLEADEVVQGLRREMDTLTAEISKTLTVQNLQNSRNFASYLQQLTRVQERFESIGRRLEACIQVNGLLADLYGELRVEYVNNYAEANAFYQTWKTLNESAIALLSQLNNAYYTEEKNQILIDWIRTNILHYHAAKLSPLHNWALSFLGKFFITCDLSQDGLDAAVALFREFPQHLLKHCRDVDVELQLNGGQIEMSHLKLAVISDRMKEEQCTVGAIKGLHTKPWLSCGKKQGKPRLVLPLTISNADGHAVHDRSVVMTRLLDVLQNNKYQELLQLDTEQRVALFECAHYILRMPASITNLWIELVNTHEFRSNLSMLQWLRFAQASGVVLPYNDLGMLFERCTAEEFGKWISLYDKSRVKVNANDHHMLFSASFELAQKLLLDKANHFTDKEVEAIFAYLADRYLELKEMNNQRVRKDLLDSQMITLACLCIARTGKLQPHPVIQDLTMLYTDSLEKTKEVFTKPVIQWLETVIYPKLRMLALDRGVQTQGLGDFSKCRSLETFGLAEPDGEIELKHFMQNPVTKMQLAGGTLDMKQVAKFPVRVLHLASVKGVIAFEDCRELAKELVELDCRDVWFPKGALSWVAESDVLTTLSIKPVSNCIVGSLANGVRVHNSSSLRNLELIIESFDNEPDLIASLKNLLRSFPTLSTITLKGQYDGSFLAALLEERRVDNQIETLRITHNQSTNLGLLVHFKKLKNLTFYSDEIPRLDGLELGFKSFTTITSREDEYKTAL
ncbi:MAG: hypothetical protein JSS12_08920 [Verrucomicrobia bacterium]|nr:hypothetical protein [Verrucomicrobiota bacterium]